MSKKKKKMSDEQFRNFVDWLLGKKNWKEAFGTDIPKPTNKL